MAISQELFEQIEKAYAEFVATINKNGVRYLNSAKNCEAIKRLLKDSNVTSNQNMEPLGLPFVWITGWADASAAGLLDEPAAPETPAEAKQRELEKNVRLEVQDRHAGSRYGNKDKTDERKEFGKFIKERKELKERLQKEAADRRTAAAQKKIDDNDMSVIPTAEQMLAGQVFSSERLKQLSAAQLRRYVRNEAGAKRLSLAQKADEQREGQ